MSHVEPARRLIAAVRLILTLILLSGRGASAQQSQLLTVGDSVTGSLSDSIYQVSYRLLIKTSGTVTISMITDRRLDGRLILQDAHGTTLAESDDTAPDSSATLVYAFDRADQYTLIATRYGGLNGPSIGPYTLSIRMGSFPPAIINPTATLPPTPTMAVAFTPTPEPIQTLRPTATQSEFVEGGSLSNGDSVTATIDDDHPAYLYTFEGELGQQITMTMTGDDHLQPSLYLVSGADYSTLDSTEARNGEIEAALDYVLPANGEYGIVATRRSRLLGTNAGVFTLSVKATSSIVEIVVTGAPQHVIAGLQARGIVPKGGKLLFALSSEAVVRDSSPGYTFSSVGAGVTAREFVLNFQITPAAINGRYGCGVGFWRTGDEDYASAWINEQGQVTLSQLLHGDMIMRFGQQSDQLIVKGTSAITVIAVQNKVTMYIDGLLAGAAKGHPVQGGYSADLYIPPGIKALTTCTFPKGWVWTFDR